MDDKIMRLFSISSISNGRRHTAIVQDISMQSAIKRYCGYYAGQAENMVSIQGCKLKLNCFDDFGKLIPGIAEVPT